MLKFGCELLHRIFKKMPSRGRGGRLAVLQVAFSKGLYVELILFQRPVSVYLESLVLPYFVCRTFDVLSVACSPIYFYWLLVDQQAKKLRCSRFWRF